MPPEEPQDRLEDHDREEKTEGHRTHEESQVLDEVLYDLQLRYVAATKRSGR